MGLFRNSSNPNPIAPRDLLDYARLMQRAKDGSKAYQKAVPFPNAVFDDFLPAMTLRHIVDEFPSPDQAVRWNRIEVETDDGRQAQYNKLHVMDESSFGPYTRQLFWELNSSRFIRFLERLTGIPKLLPDPHLRGGGLHQILPGGMLRVHADFNKHPALDLDRRLNVLIYLNEDWREAYGGHIELWEAGMAECRARYLPIANRCLIFSTTSVSFHGHPHPLSCPDGMSRKSVAMYYYTLGRPETEAQPKHKTLWQDLPREHDESA
jgi:Rps23 Pro-64 3,4-dihydroxylase Tpa1-like proline 4-hydroxylase